MEKATIEIKKHMISNTHCEAVEAVITLPQMTEDIGEQLCAVHEEEKWNAHQMLRVIFQVSNFLPDKILLLEVVLVMILTPILSSYCVL